METTKSELVGRAAYVYSSSGALLSTTVVKDYCPDCNEIAVEGCPGLMPKDSCRIIVLKRPSPYEYLGIVRRRTENSAVICLYRVSACRRSERHKLKHPAAEVELLNLSKGGFRVGADAEALAIGDRLELFLAFAGIEKRLLAEVVNSTRAGPGRSEYGCRLVTRTETVTLL